MSRVTVENLNDIYRCISQLRNERQSVIKEPRDEFTINSIMKGLVRYILSLWKLRCDRE